MMKDICTYLLKLRGQVNDDEVNIMSPIQMKVKHVEPEGTLLTLYTDQSGLVGLMSYLHGLGFTFLSLTCVDLSGVEDH
ncbi:MAG: hypothetical protein AB9907_09855 [Flexilinea sp.]